MVTSGTDPEGPLGRAQLLGALLAATWPTRTTRTGLKPRTREALVTVLASDWWQRMRAESQQAEILDALVEIGRAKHPARSVPAALRAAAGRRALAAAVWTRLASRARAATPDVRPVDVSTTPDPAPNPAERLEARATAQRDAAVLAAVRADPVMAAVLVALGSTRSLAAAARQAGVSPRTLYRKLAGFRAGVPICQ